MRETADVAPLLDVVFYLVEDATFERQMEWLFDALERYVVVHSSNHEAAHEASSPHVRHRRFVDWIAARRPDWELFRTLLNPYPYRGDPRTGSFADFCCFRRRAS